MGPNLSIPLLLLPAGPWSIWRKPPSDVSHQARPNPWTVEHQAQHHPFPDMAPGECLDVPNLVKDISNCGLPLCFKRGQLRFLGSECLLEAFSGHVQLGGNSRRQQEIAIGATYPFWPGNVSGFPRMSRSGSFLGKTAQRCSVFRGQASVISKRLVGDLYLLLESYPSGKMQPHLTKATGESQTRRRRNR
ncbi:hypothetical protein CHARACLAT_015706 [Characodon lateralis]|uniref:Uncharacterized protein n=1 Tax=Characodon lateralis TaxID=208331 RepID=A0ABU7EJN5_9TELE|nr:hypothetical protein [Characodon lateralis]